MSNNNEAVNTPHPWSQPYTGDLIEVPPEKHEEHWQEFHRLFPSGGITWELVNFSCAHRLVGREVWAPIVGYEGLYEVSDLGNVRSLTHIDSLGREQTGRQLAPWVWEGYRTVSLSKGAKRRRGKKICHLVAAAFIGERVSGEEVCHNDGNSQNDCADNLRYDTHAGNMKDRWAHGTMLYGEAISGSKLTVSEVVDILRLKRRGWTYRELGRTFGVSQHAIKDISTGKTWGHLSNPKHPGYIGDLIQLLKVPR